MKFIFEIHNEKKITENNKVLVLDRDGVIINDTGYLIK